MPTDPRAPVIVGVGAVTQHEADPARALDALELMVHATERAGADSGVPGLLRRIDLAIVAQGIWSYRDPGRVVAARFGAADAGSVIGEIGVLQQTLLTRATEAVARGQADVVLVCGSEAKQRALLAAKEGWQLADVDPSTQDADEVLRPVGDILSRTEIERDLAVPAHQYATIESAIAHAAGRSPVEQRVHASELWARFAAVAQTNEHAWDRAGYAAASIGTPGPRNRTIATPYTKRLCSQWNVDQAAALLLTSAETADRLGVVLDRRVFPLAAAESNQMVPLPCRDEIHRWPAFETVADALGLTGPGARTLDVVDLYSCFPAAVQVQAAALGLPLDAPLTVSGGMTFGGGPLNSAVLQAMVPLVGRLRADPAGLGLVTSVSAMLTKPAGSLWSATPPSEGTFRGVDVTAAATARTGVRALLPDAVGPATVAAHTVIHIDGAPVRAVAVLDVEGGRTVARSDDAAIAVAMTETDWVGRAVRLVSPREFVAD